MQLCGSRLWLYRTVASSPPATSTAIVLVLVLVLAIVLVLVLVVLDLLTVLVPVLTDGAKARPTWALAPPRRSLSINFRLLINI